MLYFLPSTPAATTTSILGQTETLILRYFTAFVEASLQKQDVGLYRGIFSNILTSFVKDKTNLNAFLDAMFDGLSHLVEKPDDAQIRQDIQRCSDTGSAFITSFKGFSNIFSDATNKTNQLNLEFYDLFQELLADRDEIIQNSAYGIIYARKAESVRKWARLTVLGQDILLRAIADVINDVELF